MGKAVMFAVIDTSTHQIVALYDNEDDAWCHVVRPEIVAGVNVNLDVQELDEDEAAELEEPLD